MATIASGGLTAERRFYSGMAIAMIAIVLIGFAPSFYFRGLVTSPRPNPTLPPLVMLHGLMFSLWMIIFWAQTALIAVGRRDLHMRFGVAAMAFAALLVPLMYFTAIGQVARANQPPMVSPLSWTAVPLFPIPAFVALVVLGWKHRRQAQAHKRLMLGAALIMMDPAIGRLPIMPPVIAGFAVLNLLSWLTFVPLFIWDKRTIGRLHWATKLGAAVFGAALILRLLALSTPHWERVAAYLPGL